MYIIRLQGELIVESGQELTEDLARKLKILRLSRLRSVRFLPVNPKKEYVQNVMDVTWQTDEWFRKVKLLV